MVVGGMHGCGGACVVAGGHVWLQGEHAWLWGCAWLQGGMHGCSGHAWLLGVHGCRACMVAGGIHGCRGMVCMVAGGHAWLQKGAWLQGGMCGCGECVWLPGGCIGYDKIWSMSGQYTSYWNAFLFHFISFYPCLVK